MAPSGDAGAGRDRETSCHAVMSTALCRATHEGTAMTLTATLSLPVHAATAAPKAPRHDLYVAIHKALRQFMSDTLSRLGTMDLDDDEERAAALSGVLALLGLLRSHLQHENDFIHTAIEARRPGAARHTADDHFLHVDAIANLEDEARAVRDARAEQRPALALQLYRHLAEFVGENLVHMQVEETRNNAALWELYDDAELQALHDRLLVSVGPAEMALAVRWMAAALAPQELAGLFGGMQKKAPPPAFEALLAVAHGQLDEKRWAKLARALGRPAVPGLMTA
jgi:hypothetical protein